MRPILKLKCNKRDKVNDNLKYKKNIKIKIKKKTKTLKTKKNCEDRPFSTIFFS